MDCPGLGRKPRISQLWHNGHFRLGYALLWEPVLCTVGALQTSDPCFWCWPVEPLPPSYHDIFPLFWDWRNPWKCRTGTSRKFSTAREASHTTASKSCLDQFSFIDFQRIVLYSVRGFFFLKSRKEKSSLVQQVKDPALSLSGSPSVPGPGTSAGGATHKKKNSHNHHWWKKW